jgi:Tol biopolymer transport system component
LNTAGRLAIASIALPGKNVTLLTGKEYDSSEPAFSPDGSQVFFASNRDGIFAIYSMSISGGDQKRLTKGGDHARMPMPTANAGELLVAKRGGIYRLDLETGKEHLLSFKGDYAPSWHTR